jgi:hypothetical protein
MKFPLTAKRPFTVVATMIAATTLAIGAASAADQSAKSDSAMSSSAMSKKPTQAMAADNLSLTHSQERTAWRDIHKQASRQSAPSGFTASIGATVPNGISLQSMPAKVAARVTSLKPYDYALLPDKLLIVNPTDKKVVDVITHRA